MVEVRAATPDDAAAIRRVHLAAFPTPAEAGLVEALERGGDRMISLVAIEGESIVGHILFSRMDAQGDGRVLSALGLAPVAVVPSRQRQSIGSTLIDAGLRAARSAGTDLVFLVGDPAYYGRFGFAVEIAVPFASPYAGPYFQAKILAPDFELPTLGRVDYAPAFAALT